MKRIVVLLAAALVLALFVSQVQADRLIVAPTGSVLGSGGIKAEAAFRSSNGDSISEPRDSDQINWLNVGLGRFEIEGRRLVRSDGMDKNTVGFEACVLPETIITPAVGLGVRDITNEYGRSYYLAVSKTVPLSDKLPLPIHDVKLHGGIGVDGELKGPFAGVEVGLPMRLTLCGEVLRSKFNASLAFSPIPKVSVKAYSLDSKIFYGADLKLTF